MAFSKRNTGLHFALFFPLPFSRVPATLGLIFDIPLLIYPLPPPPRPSGRAEFVREFVRGKNADGRGTAKRRFRYLLNISLNSRACIRNLPGMNHFAGRVNVQPVVSHGFLHNSISSKWKTTLFEYSRLCTFPSPFSTKNDRRTPVSPPPSPRRRAATSHHFTLGNLQRGYRYIDTSYRAPSLYVYFTSYASHLIHYYLIALLSLLFIITYLLARFIIL